MNPFLRKMGCTDEDRVLITHADDIGFCHAANLGSFACLASGAASCGSILVNAPWFTEAATMSRDGPAFDMGVHLTLTSEYPTYRWSALSTRDADSGLLDRDGYLWRTREDAVRHVGADAAKAEMRAQIETALSAGIDITHIDTHMGSVVHPKFLPHYLALADEYGVPAFLPNLTRDRLAEINHDDIGDDYVEVLGNVATEEVPTIDEIIIDTLVPLHDKRQYYRDLIEAIEPGLTHLLFHPAIDGEELTAITDSHASRNADYEAFRDPHLKHYIDQAGIIHIGYRELKAGQLPDRT